jgi:hypothetical protein
VIPNSMKFRAASALVAVCVALALATWYAKPDSALAVAAVLAMCGIMGAALYVSRRGVRRFTAEATTARSFESITTGVVFAALMMGISLAVTLARSYGLVDGDEVARRSTGVLIGIFLAMLGNVMPKNRPSLSSPGCDGSRQQAFHRRAGWTWVLCGLGSAIGWAVLPIDSAEIAAIGLTITAMAVTVVHLVRLARRKDEPAHGLN